MLKPTIIQSLSYPEEAPSCSPNECCGYLDRSEQCLHANRVMITLNADHNLASAEVGIVNDLEAILIDVGFMAGI